MFSKILKSKARRQLFEIFFKDSRQKYYLRELADMLRYSPGSLQRELSSLEKDGLLISEKTGNMKFFSINRKSPFISGLKKTLAATPPEPAKLKIRHEKSPPKKEPERPIIKPEQPKDSPSDEPLRMHIE